MIVVNNTPWTLRHKGMTGYVVVNTLNQHCVVGSSYILDGVRGLSPVGTPKVFVF